MWRLFLVFQLFLANSYISIRMTDLVVVGKTISPGSRYGETASKPREENEGLAEQGLSEQQIEERMDKFISVGVCAMDSKVPSTVLGVLLVVYNTE